MAQPNKEDLERPIFSIRRSIINLKKTKTAMSTRFLFDFSVNKANNTIQVKREFAADLDLVWEAWTNPELLDLWWAPKPYRTQTKSMDFSEGGYWHYCMISPENEVHWCRADYQKVEPKKSFSGLDAFCDENGAVVQDFPRSLWNNVFAEKANKTTLVEITISYDSLSDLEKVVEMGFKEGFSMALENLDQYLETRL